MIASNHENVPSYLAMFSSKKFEGEKKMRKNEIKIKNNLNSINYFYIFFQNHFT